MTVPRPATRRERLAGIGLWALTNTASLNTATPALSITSRLINSQTYVFPPQSDQKAGDIPLG